MTYRPKGTGVTRYILAALLLTAVSTVSHAEDGAESRKVVKTLGTDPGQATYAGSDSSAGAPPMTIRTSTSEWNMGFHGYLRAPARMSFDNHKVEKYVLDNNGDPILGDDGLYELEDSGDRDWRFNMPPATADNAYTTWAFTNNLPGPWAEMVFSYGNSIAQGNVSIASWNLTDGGWRNLTAQLGIDQAWVSLNFPRAFGKWGGLKLDGGVFGNRYGTAGRYDAGRYDTYIFGRTHLGGETLTANLDLAKNVTLFLEHGFGLKTEVLRGNPQGDLNTSPQDGDNSYAWIPYAAEGQVPAMVNHAHAGVLLHDLALWKELQVNAHFMHAFTNSADESDNPDPNAEQEKDGKYIIAGAEIKFNGAVFGDLYLGYSNVHTENIGRMPDAVEVIHSLGGWSFAKNYYGDTYLTITSDGDRSRDGDLNPGNGVVNTFAWQYMFSISRLVWFLKGQEFWGQGPDLQISFWGMYNHISVDKDLEPYLKRYAKNKLKLGAEAMYTPLKYLGMGVRFDRVMSDLDYDADDEDLNDSMKPTYAPFSIISPVIRIKTAFVTHEEFSIQYSRYLWSGDRNEVRAEHPFENISADRNAVMLSVNMWW